MMSGIVQSDWFVWGIGLILGFQILVVVLGELLYRADRRALPMAPILRAARNVVLPLVTDIGSGVVSRPVSLNTSNGGDDRTAACFQYVPDGFDGHFVATRDSQAITDWTSFVNSSIATGTPTVP